MALIKDIGIGMSADTRDYTLEVLKAASSLDRISESATRAQSAVGSLDFTKGGGSVAGPEVAAPKGGLDAGEIGAQFDLLAARMKASLQSALAPLGTFAATFGRQFSQVGGTVIETSRRVASGIKVIAGESLKNLYAGKMANPETGKLRIDDKSFRSALGLSGQLEQSTRNLVDQFGNMARAEQGMNLAPFRAVTSAVETLGAAVAKLTHQFELMGKAVGNAMGKAARAAASAGTPGEGPFPVKRVITPGVARKRPTVVPDLPSGATTARKAAGPAAVAPATRADAGEAMARAAMGTQAVTRSAAAAAAGVHAVGQEASALDRFFGTVNRTLDRQIDLVEKARKAEAARGAAAKASAAKLPARGAAGERLTTDVDVSKKFAPFLSDKDVSKGLGKFSAGAGLNRAVQEASLLGAQFRMLPPFVQNATASVTRFGAAVAVGLGFTGLVYKGTQALVGFFRGGVMGASDLNETISKTGFVFGDSAQVIIKAADQMSKSFGVSRKDFIEGAVSLGRYGKAAGLSQAASASLGVDLAKLGADLSSIENIGTDTAMERIGAAIAGQTEVLRRHGALLSEERTKQEAVTRGWSKGKGELADSTKVMARISLIFQDLKDAQGDLARTADSPANAMRRVSGQLSNLATGIGTVLLPALSSGLTFAGQVLTYVSATVESAKGYFETFAAGVSEAFNVAGIAVRNWQLVGQIAFLKAQELGTNFIEVLAVIPENFSLIGNYLRDNWFKVLTDMYHASRSISENIDKNFVNLFHSLQDFFSGKGFHFEWTGLLEGFQATADKLPELIRPNLSSMQSEIDKVGGQIAKNEANRKKAGALEATKPTVPQFDAKDKDKAGKAKEKDNIAALELGSKEAGSAIAKFRNQDTKDDKPIKETAKSAAELVALKKQQMQSRAYESRARESGNNVALAIAKL